MFELASVGVPILFFGSIYLVLFGNKLIPRRETLTSILSDEERKEFMTEAFVRMGSELVGQTAKESNMLKGRGIRLLEIVRHGVAVRGSSAIALQAGDRPV